MLGANNIWPNRPSERVEGRPLSIASDSLAVTLAVIPVLLMPFAILSGFVVQAMLRLAAGGRWGWQARRPAPAGFTCLAPLPNCQGFAQLGAG